jgi:hypothetical protein
MKTYSISVVSELRSVKRSKSPGHFGMRQHDTEADRAAVVLKVDCSV